MGCASSTGVVLPPPGLHRPLARARPTCAKSHGLLLIGKIPKVIFYNGRISVGLLLPQKPGEARLGSDLSLRLGGLTSGYCSEEEHTVHNLRLKLKISENSASITESLVIFAHSLQGEQLYSTFVIDIH